MWDLEVEVFVFLTQLEHSTMRLHSTAVALVQCVCYLKCFLSPAPETECIYLLLFIPLRNASLLAQEPFLPNCISVDHYLFTNIESGRTGFMQSILNLLFWLVCWLVSRGPGGPIEWVSFARRLGANGTVTSPVNSFTANDVF